MIAEISSWVGKYKFLGKFISAYRIRCAYSRIRSLTPFQRKILQAYADDIEGRNPQVHFGPLPSDPPVTSPSSPPKEPTNGEGSYPSYRSQNQPQAEHAPHRPSRPPAEPYKPYNPLSSSEEPISLANKLASAIGGAIGWVERFMRGRR